MSEHFPAFALALLALAATGCAQSIEGLPPADADEPSPERVDEVDEADANVDEDEDEPAPLDEAARRCLLGERSSDWTHDDALGLGAFETVFDDRDLADLAAAQLTEGLDAWEWFDFDDLRMLFSTLDGERVELRDVDIAGVHESFTHIRFHFRGFEYGLVYATNSMRAVAGIEQGVVVGCELLAD